MALFNILVDIAAKTAGFEEGIKRVEKQIEHFGDVAKEVGKTALEFAGIGLSFKALAAGIDEAIKRGDQMQRLADRMHTTTENLTQLEYAAKLADVPFQSLADSVDIMSKNIGMAAEGTGRAQRAFTDLGLSAAELVKIPLDKQLEIIADKIAGLPNATEQARVAMQIFGGAGASLLPILKDGAEGVRKFREESDQVGNTLRGKTAKALAETDESIKRLKASWTSLMTSIASGSSHVLTPTFDVMRKAFGGETELEKTKARIKDIRYMLFDAPKGSGFAEIGRQNFEALNKELTSLEAKLSKSEEVSPVEHIFSPSTRAELEENFKWLEDQMARVGKRQLNPQLKEELDANMKWLEDQKRLHDQELELTQTANDAEVASYQNKMAAITDLLNAEIISEEEAAKRRNEIMENEFKEFTVTQQKQVTQYKKSRYEMEQIEKRFAESAQNDLTEFFLNPAKEGFDGLVRAFIADIARMEAEKASSTIFGYLKNIDWSSLFSGGSSGGSSGGGDTGGDTGGVMGMAGGGSVDAGKLYRINENGMEYFRPSVSGTVIPIGGAKASGGIVFSPTYNIDASGNSDLVQALPRLLKQTHDAAIETMQSMRKRGRF